MSSNWSVWDYLGTQNFIKKDLVDLPVFFEVPDSYIGKILKDKIKESTDYMIKFPFEIDESWIEDQCDNLSLFGSPDIYLIPNFELAKKEIVQSLISRKDNWGQARFIFISEKPLSKVDKELGKAFNPIKITSPKFWENRKLLEFLVGHFELNLSYDAISYLIDTLEGTSAKYFEAVMKIFSQANHSELIQLDEVKRIFVNKHLDIFELASIFSQKKSSRFYELILKNTLTDQEIISFSIFMQSHLFKVLDPSYISKKNKISKYDKQIQSYVSLWERDELINAMKMFDAWEVLGKSRDVGFTTKIKEAYLASLYNKNAYQVFKV